MEPSAVIKIMSDNLINFSENKFCNNTKGLDSLFHHICNMLKKAPIDHNVFTVVNSACDIYTNNNFRELKWCAFTEPHQFFSHYIRISLSIMTTDTDFATLSFSISSNNNEEMKDYKKTCYGYILSNP